MINARSSSRWPWFLFLLPLVAVPGIGGCLTAPPVEPTPTPVPEPTGYVFNPADALPKGKDLNSADDATIPAFFHLAQIVSGDVIYVQGIRDGKFVGDKLLVHLAGIVAPEQGQPGWQSSVQTLTNWAAGQELTVSQDPKYPYDIYERPLVNITFKGRKGSPYENQPMSLNRMMVRSGYALVDLYSATSFTESKDWLKDEAHAKAHKFGLWKIPGIFEILQQRNAGKAAAKPAAGGTPAPAGKPASGGKPTPGGTPGGATPAGKPQPSAKPN